MTCRALITLYSLGFLFSGCYNLKGISIAPNINTFYIDLFQNGVSNAPPDINQRFTDEFRDLVLQNTRLVNNEQLPDIEFSGSVSNFRVESVAPQQTNDTGGRGAFGSTINRLNISVRVEYVNNTDDEDTWVQTFSFFGDFSNEEVLEDVQDELIEEIFDQILQDIFTRAFTDW